MDNVSNNDVSNNSNAAAAVAATPVPPVVTLEDVAGCKKAMETIEVLVANGLPEVYAVLLCQETMRLNQQSYLRRFETIQREAVTGDSISCAFFWSDSLLGAFWVVLHEEFYRLANKGE